GDDRRTVEAVAGAERVSFEDGARRLPPLEPHGAFPAARFVRAASGSDGWQGERPPWRLGPDTQVHDLDRLLGKRVAVSLAVRVVEGASKTGGGAGVPRHPDLELERLSSVPAVRRTNDLGFVQRRAHVRLQARPPCRQLGGRLV